MKGKPVTAMKFVSDLVARGRYCYSAEEAVGDLKYHGEIWVAFGR